MRVRPGPRYIPDIAALPPAAHLGRPNIDSRCIAASLGRMNALGGQGYSPLSMYLRHGNTAHSYTAWANWQEAWEVASTRALVPGALNRSARKHVDRLLAQCAHLFGTVRCKGVLS